ncbi:hypothetical protein E4U14_003446 [Claviceps sp. LM454 group G7]|nr:hypothetical protein E4U14_003446 [Claviceps sp. LM454 group G7]
MAPLTIETIPRSGLQNLVTSDAAHITKVKSVSSYSWIETPTPTIAVPGSPPLWSPPVTDVQLRKDSGLYNIAENAVRLPDRPLAPIFSAIFTTNPSFNIRSIDVISDRNNIRKLLSFIDPISMTNGSPGESFTIKLELVRNTLLMCRHETATTRYIGPHEFRGYGREFEKAYTTNQIEGSAGHFRIISYRFCGMNLMIRHETDGFVSPSKQVGYAERSYSVFQHSRNEAASPAVGSGHLQMVTVLQKGKTIPLESILEIKTRALTRSLHFAEIAPQLWVSQTPKLVRAYHDRGCFRKQQVEDVSGEVQQWERENQGNLRTLGALIGKIMAVMKGCGGCGTLRYDVATASLIISRDEGGSGMLPKDLYSRWDD